MAFYDPKIENDRIRHKRSFVSGEVPASLRPGELAVNVADGVIFYGDHESEVGQLPSLVDGKIPSSQLPSYVDDVVEYANLEAFPAVGEAGKVYVAVDTGKTYRWGGSIYILVSAVDYDQSLNTTDSVTFTSVSLPNATQITVGSFDNSTGGASGLSLHCAVGYELNWQGGRLRSVMLGDAAATPQPIWFDSPVSFQAGASGVSYADLSDLPVLFSGSYADLTDKPNIPEAYSLPTASASVLGGVKVGSGITITDGVISAAGSGPVAVALAYASTLNTDASAGDIFDVTLTGNATLANPTNPVNGKTIRWRIRQDATGSRTVTLGDKFVIPSSATSPLPFSTAANKMDILAATYHAGRDKWDVVAFVMGY